MVVVTVAGVQTIGESVDDAVFDCELGIQVANVFPETLDEGVAVPDLSTLLQDLVSFGAHGVREKLFGFLSILAFHLYHSRRGCDVCVK